MHTLFRGVTFRLPQTVMISLDIQPVWSEDQRWTERYSHRILYYALIHEIQLL